jgi:hypothetical protein
VRRKNLFTVPDEKQILGARLGMIFGADAPIRRLVCV